MLLHLAKVTAKKRHAAPLSYINEAPISSYYFFIVLSKQRRGDDPLGSAHAVTSVNGVLLL